MWAILILLFMTGIALAIVKLSLMRPLMALPMILAITLLPLGLYHLSLRVNIKMLTTLATNYGTMTTICTAAITESLAVMILSVRLMETHFRVRKSQRRTMLVFLPPIVVCAGLVTIQTLLFNLVVGQTFMHTAMLNASAVLMVLAAGGIVMRILIRSWISRVEFMVVLAFFQLILAMFLPVIAAGLEMPRTQFAIDPSATGIVCAIVLIVTAAGYLLSNHGLLPGKGIHS